MWPGPMRRWLPWLTVLVACTPPAPESEEAPPPIIERLVRDLAEGGIPARAERLRDLREFPGCERARFRYRLRFADDFVNVSRFETSEQAQACLGEFRATVLKAGDRAWEMMRNDITTHGPWLFFFPPRPEGEGRRAEVIAILRSADGVLD
ncbi:MAG TPA: hypothetical protein VKY51_08635 [Fredinandcohnia sp.]|nr:hypothetical protein [Fredinandcohnia sp.]